MDYLTCKKKSYVHFLPGSWSARAPGVTTRSHCSEASARRAWRVGSGRQNWCRNAGTLSGLLDSDFGGAFVDDLRGDEVLGGPLRGPTLLDELRAPPLKLLHGPPPQEPHRPLELHVEGVDRLPHPRLLRRRRGRTSRPCRRPRNQRPWRWPWRCP